MSVIKDYVEISCIVKHYTDAAILINDGIQDHWLPLTQVEISESDFGKTGCYDILVKEWLAYEKGLI